MKFLEPFFQRVPFLANIESCPKSLEYALQIIRSLNPYIYSIVPFFACHFYIP